MFDPGLLHRPVTLIFRPVVDADPARFWALMRPEEKPNLPSDSRCWKLVMQHAVWFRLPAADGNSGQRRHEWMGTNRSCRWVGGKWQGRDSCQLLNGDWIARANLETMTRQRKDTSSIDRWVSIDACQTYSTPVDKYM